MILVKSPERGLASKPLEKRPFKHASHNMEKTSHRQPFRGGVVRSVFWAQFAFSTACGLVFARNSSMETGFGTP